jgi:hypothetical protein
MSQILPPATTVIADQAREKQEVERRGNAVLVELITLEIREKDGGASSPSLITTRAPFQIEHYGVIETEGETKRRE